MSSDPTPDLSLFAKNGRKILGIALNYKKVIEKKNVPVPTNPVVFQKPTSSYITEGTNIVIPRVFTTVAHEVELACVIGKRCKNVARDDAMQYVGGYCLALDLTAQCNLGEARKVGHPWTLGKGFDTATPVSEFIPASKCPDPHNLEIWLKVNGTVRQSSNTNDLLFQVPVLIEYISKYMVLEPNDIILTGTPDGATRIVAGDMIECALGDLVTMKFNVVDEDKIVE